MLTVSFLAKKMTLVTHFSNNKIIYKFFERISIQFKYLMYICSVSTYMTYLITQILAYETLVTVSGENVIEFPYAGDANYSEHPSMYFSVETTYWDHNKQHVVTIQTKNKYSSDWQTFVVE